VPRWPRRSLSEPQRSLAARAFPGARRQALAFARARGADRDECESLAGLTASLAAFCWREAEGVSFEGYVAASLARELRAWRRSRAARPAGEALPADPAGPWHCPEPPELEGLLPLAGPHAEALRLHYVEGLVLREVGRRLGVSRQRAEQRCRAGRAMIAAALAG
jgi:DNA-directed RNA polymerase specialized sigma24 family protein